MAKYVVFSFDDGRMDTYTNAYKILKGHGISATLNVATDFINHPENYDNFLSADNKPMTWEQIHECGNNGWEIACHGHKHINDVNDINECIVQLKKHGIDKEKYGFASPNSEINDFNLKNTFKDGYTDSILYVRSGLQRKREGIFYAGLSFLNCYVKSKHLFCLLNKRCILKINNAVSKRVMLSVGISSDVTVGEIIALIKSLGDEEGIILMFHSILSDDESSMMVDNWWWAEEKLKKLCDWITKNEIKVLTTKQLVEYSLSKEM